MSQNSITITKDNVEDSGKLQAQHGALHDLKPIIASMIDSVRGDDELVITCEIKKSQGKKNAKAVKKTSSGNDSKPSKSGSSKSKKLADEKDGKSDEGDGGKKESQEIDPLSEEAPKN